MPRPAPISITASPGSTPASSPGAPRSASSTRKFWPQVAARAQAVARERARGLCGAHAHCRRPGRRAERHAREGLEREAVALAARQQPRARGGDHRGVVGAQRGRREDHARSRRARAAASSAARRRRFAATPPTTARRAQRPARASARRARATSTSTAACLEGGGEIGDVARAERPRALRSTSSATAVLSPLKEKSSPGAPASGRGKRERRRVAALRGRARPRDRPGRRARAASRPCRRPRPRRRRASRRAARRAPRPPRSR